MAGEGAPGGPRRQSQSVSTENRGILGRLRSFFELSMLLSAWEGLVAASVVPSVILLIFQAAFDAGIVWQWVLIYLCDGLYVAAIVVRLLTDYCRKGRALAAERRRKSLVFYYLKLSVDVASVVPLEVFAFAATGSRGETLELAAILRLTRFIRCYRTWGFISKCGIVFREEILLWVTFLLADFI